MNDDEDDKPTVVIDFNELKSQLNEEEELTEQEDIDNLFSDDFLGVEPLEAETTNKEEVSNQSIYLFDYQSDYFKKALPMYLNNQNMHMIESVDDLNKALTNDPKAIILFFYNKAPKAVNMLTLQIKSKFKKAKAVIIAKNLSAEKAQLHSNSKYGAHSYLNDPFTLSELYQTINFLEK